MNPGYMVRVFSNAGIVLEGRTESLDEALANAEGIGGLCSRERLDQAYSVVYDYVPWGWRPLCAWVFVNGSTRYVAIHPEFHMKGGHGV